MAANNLDFFNESISLGAMPGLPLATVITLPLSLAQSVATLEKKIQADNQAIEQQTQAEETAKQAIQKEQEEQAKTSNVDFSG
jgi:flagellar biosynthesis component FlhA